MPKSTSCSCSDDPNQAVTCRASLATKILIELSVHLRFHDGEEVPVMVSVSHSFRQPHSLDHA